MPSLEGSEAQSCNTLIVLPGFQTMKKTEKVGGKKGHVSE